MSITSATGGWLSPPAADAERLIDNTWNGWAPNFGSVATADVALGGAFSLSEVRVFTDNNAGNIEIRLAGGNWQTLSYNSTSPWKVLPVSGTVSEISLRRNSTVDNVVELRVCSGGSGLPTLSIGDVTVQESGGSANFNVSLSAAASGLVTVQYATANGTAASGSDYTTQSGTLSFTVGSTQQTIAVPVVDDAAIESNETFRVDLSNPSGATLATSQGTGTIIDNDTSISGCTVPADTSIIEAGPNENPSGWVSLTTDAAVIAALTGVEVTVTENTTVGNVLNVVDGWNQTPIVSGAADVTTVVAIPQGTFSGSVQAFLGHATGGQYRASLKLCTGGGGTPQIAVNDASVNEGDGSATFTVSLSVADTVAVTVDVDTRNGSAQAGSDYSATSQQVTFSAGSNVSQTVTVPILEDAAVEATESFLVDLSNVSANAAIADGEGVGTIFDNDSTGTCTYDPNSNHQDDRPQNCGVTPSDTFGLWTARLDANMLSNLGTACIDLHDRYWIRAEDQRAYHTWHPSEAQGCAFGHEHGTDPSTSEAFPYSGGYPPFGFVMEQQQRSNPSMPRHEDHFGHKVTVANNIRIAIGNSADGNTPNVHATGITCDFLSKIHMGTHSADAFTNHLHEYFLTLQCDDGPLGSNTQFSVKQLAPFETPNQIDSLFGGLHRINDVTGTLQSAITRSEDDNVIDQLTTPHVATPVGTGGGRQFKEFPAMQWNPMHLIDQTEIWAMSSNNLVQIPNGGGVKFAPYYHVKNPSRLLDEANGLVVRTVELCYQNGNRVPGPFCSFLPQAYPGSTFWKTTGTSFNGGLRSINFKGFGLTNATGPTTFCTNVFGGSPELISNCGPFDVRQKAATFRNYWQEQGNTANPCVPDVDGTCHRLNLEGTIEKADFVYPTAANDRCNVAISQGVAPPYINNGVEDGVVKAGIGLEWFANHCEDPGIHPPN